MLHHRHCDPGEYGSATFHLFNGALCLLELLALRLDRPTLIRETSA